MARNSLITILRTTRANLTTQAGASNVRAGELYLVTDENRLAIGLTTTTTQDFAKLSEAGGGSDPWTVLKRTTDFTTSSASAVDITGLGFTPAANTTYMVEGMLALRTATTTVGPRPGLAWSTGLTDGTATIWTSSSATAQTMVNGNISGAILAAVGGLPTTTGSFPAYIQAIVVAGASPSGQTRLQLASETAATNVIAKTGSWLRYRII